MIRQYLNKTHRYRNKQFALPQRATVISYFDNDDDEIIYKNCLYEASRWFGLQPGAVQEGDLFVSKVPCLWGFQGGFGGHNAINNDPPQSQFHRHSSDDLANPANEPPIGFYMLHGSFFVNWNTTNNFLRATLGTPNYGVGTLWVRRGKWRLESLAVGDTMGIGLLHMQNDTNFALADRNIFLALMGDPSLQLNVVAPPLNLLPSTSGGNVLLSWSISLEPSVSYHVYRSTNGLSGTFTRLTSSPIRCSNYTDPSAPSGEKIYQVRAVDLRITGSGSYTNVSQGTFVTVN